MRSKFIRLTSIFILLLSSYVSKADQLAYITLKQAKKTVKYLKKKKIREIVLFCGCCENDPKTKVHITSVFYRHTGYGDYYEVVVEGHDESGRNMSESFDLAYAHIRKGRLWTCLGRLMRFDCDPCTKPFAL